MVGRLLEGTVSLVKGLAFDAHQSHVLFRRLLFGQEGELTEDDRQFSQELPFFKDCAYRDLPPHILPRLPMKLCLYKNKPVWPLPGSCCLFFFGNEFVFYFMGIG